MNKRPLKNIRKSHSERSEESLMNASQPETSSKILRLVPQNDSRKSIFNGLKNNIAIEVKNLSKVYKIYKEPKDLLKEVLFRKKRHEEFWALKNISFKIKKGEVMGIIGRNGAGKSTLLKILSGTLDKTSGMVKISGMVSAILELGTGFHPEYTGRENIYNGGMILGMSKKEIDRKVQSIIDFSELEEFIDRPFKTYSDGMKTRLTFSVATAINPEILIIDEALAAGDSFFINKCIQRITNICQSGATVLFVSHNTFLVQRLCDRAILLEKGKMKADGEPVQVCQDYEFSVAQEVNKKLKIDNTAKKEGKKILGDGPLKIAKVKITDAQNREKYSFLQGEDIKIKVFYNTPSPINNPGLYCLFVRNDGVYATSFFSGEKESFHNIINLGKLEGSGFLELTWPNIGLGDGIFYLTIGFFPKKEGSNSVMYLDPYCMHDKFYKIKIKRLNRPLQTVFDQDVKVIKGK